MQRFILIIILILSVFMIFSIAPILVHAHDTYIMGFSSWTFNKGSINASLELESFLIKKIGDIKDKNIKIDSIDKSSLKQIADNILQPYVDKKLSIWINNKKYPIKVTDLLRVTDGPFKILITIDNIALENTVNNIKIDYRLLFDESGDNHVNVASFISSGLDANESEYVFTPSAPTWEGTLKIPENSKAIQNDNIKGSTFNGTSSGNNSSNNSVWKNIGQFILLGIKHILTGYDHILFLLSLIVIGLSFKEVLRIITSFTVAHSITLFLAALQIISLNSRFVESAIALSICYISFENILKDKADNRWLVTFAFGLIHGFGFASILRDFVIGKSNLVYSVLSFNLGVEIGQIIIFLILLPVLYLLRNRLTSRNITIYVSAFVFILGLLWFIERAFNFKLL